MFFLRRYKTYITKPHQINHVLYSYVFDYSKYIKTNQITLDYNSSYECYVQYDDRRFMQISFCRIKLAHNLKTRLRFYTILYYNSSYNQLDITIDVDRKFFLQPNVRKVEKMEVVIEIGDAHKYMDRNR